MFVDYNLGESNLLALLGFPALVDYRGSVGHNGRFNLTEHVTSSRLNVLLLIGGLYACHYHSRICLSSHWLYGYRHRVSAEVDTGQRIIKESFALVKKRILLVILKVPTIVLRICRYCRPRSTKILHNESSGVVWK